MRTVLTFLLVAASFGVSAQETREICPGPLPAGWVVVSLRACGGCCNATGQIVLMPTIRRVDNTAKGTRIEVCPQPAPPGWAVVSTRTCAGCCGAAGEIVQMPVIEKL